MQMCKYCGGIISGSGIGPHGRYCTKQCWDAVEGFDKRLVTETKEGKVSIDTLSDRVGELSDGNAAMEAMFDRLDDTERQYNPRMDLGEVMRFAADIHPLLPSALVFIGQGMTQSQAAKKVGLDRGNLAKYTMQLRVKYGK